MSTASLRCVLLTALVSLGLVETASAYYDPRTGRFISRDPIGEPGFMLVQGVAASTFLPREPVVASGMAFAPPTATAFSCRAMVTRRLAH
jgi:hypothetical protein